MFKKDSIQRVDQRAINVLNKLAEKQLETVTYSPEWERYIQGVTDVLYAMDEIDLCNSYQTKLELMLEIKESEMK